MKKIVLLLFVVCATMTVNAQLYGGGSLGFWNNDDADKSVFSITPEVGYNLSEKWAVGAELGFTRDDDKNNLFQIAPYARYSYYQSGIVRLFLDGTVGIAAFKPKGGDSDTGFQVGIQPGIAVKLNDTFSLVSKVGFLGYRDKYGDEFFGQGFGLALLGNDLTFGVIVSF